MSSGRQSPQECVGRVRQMINICLSVPMHTCFMGLLSLLFNVHTTLSIHFLTLVHFALLQAKEQIPFIVCSHPIVLFLSLWLSNDSQPIQLPQHHSRLTAYVIRAVLLLLYHTIGTSRIECYSNGVREDSTLTSPFASPYGRLPMTAVGCE